MGENSTDFTIEETFIGHDRILKGLRADGKLIGLFFLDDIIKDAIKDPEDFRRMFNATVCDAPDQPGFDWKHPASKEHPDLPYLHPEVAPFFVDSFQRAARELGLPSDCEIPMSSATPAMRLPIRISRDIT